VQKASLSFRSENQASRARREDAPGASPAAGSSHAPGSRWQRQVSAWEVIKNRFGIQDNRWEEFQYLTYLDIEDESVLDYVKFHLTGTTPRIKGRLAKHLPYWYTLHTPDWLLDIIKNGFSIPFHKNPPRMLLQNCKAVHKPENNEFMRNILAEYLDSGFIEIVKQQPYCILPLQLKESSDKVSLIFDMSPLNDYVDKNKFKIEGWEEMFLFSQQAEFGIKFDIRKYYYAIDILEDHKDFFGFMYTDTPTEGPVMYRWTVLPFGYTRAPFIARQLMKPLISKWRSLNIDIVVFFDDGMAVSKDFEFLRKASHQILCDLLRAGLVPGIAKCRWQPEKIVEWNGLVFDFNRKGISIMDRRLTSATAAASDLLQKVAGGYFPGCVSSYWKISVYAPGFLRYRTDFD